MIVDVAKTLGKRGYRFLVSAWAIRPSATAFGATVTYAKELMHGKQSEVTLIQSRCCLKDAQRVSFTGSGSGDNAGCAEGNSSDR